MLVLLTKYVKGIFSTKCNIPKAISKKSHDPMILKRCRSLKRISLFMMQRYLLIEKLQTSNIQTTKQQTRDYNITFAKFASSLLSPFSKVI